MFFLIFPTVCYSTKLRFVEIVNGGTTYSVSWQSILDGVVSTSTVTYFVFNYFHLYYNFLLCILWLSPYVSGFIWGYICYVPFYPHLKNFCTLSWRVTFILMSSEKWLNSAMVTISIRMAWIVALLHDTCVIPRPHNQLHHLRKHLCLVIQLSVGMPNTKCNRFTSKNATNEKQARES